MLHQLELKGSATGRRIAVVGAGVAGLSAAWLLSRHHHVTLYEKNPWLGGHANTVDVSTPEGIVGVDTGFIVYNPPNYPNFSAMLAHLGIASVRSEMSLGVSLDSGAFEYSSKPMGLFGQPRNLASARFWTMIADVLRFYRHSDRLDEADVDEMTLGSFLDRHAYSRALAEDHILPMCAAVWSTTMPQMRAYPMRAFLRFFRSHGLLKLRGRPQWRTVQGGSRSYVRALRARMPNVSVRPAARTIARNGGLVFIEDVSGRGEVFTDVIIAAHADEALRLLEAPSEEEWTLLGAFRYTPNRAVLHDDRALMPRRRALWAAWNYIGLDGAGADRPLCVSYWMNALQKLPTSRQLFVTLNPVTEPKPESVIASFDYDHPLFDAAALAAQESLPLLQGRRNTWFCGSYFGYGFHEDALQSGLAVAAALGAPAPWVTQLTRVPPIPAGPPLLVAAE